MDLRKLAVNMIPFPRLHFLTTSLSPLQSCRATQYENINEHTLINQMFHTNNQMMILNTRQGTYLTAAAIFRGRSLSLKLLHDLMMKEQLKQRFLQWIPNNVRREP